MNTKKLLLCLLVIETMLPIVASGVIENNNVAFKETLDNALEAEAIANQMKEYYLNETGPQGNVFYTSNTLSITLPQNNEKGISKFLELPLYRQSHNFTCGVACVSSILRYAGYDFDTREDRLFWELGSTPENGTNYIKLAQYLDSVRVDCSFDTPVFETEVLCSDYPLDGEDDTLSDSLLPWLRQSLDDDSPVICVIQAWKDDCDYTTKEEDDGHYVVMIGYQKDGEKDTYNYYFMDPSTSGSYTYLSDDEFVLRWHDNLDGNPTRIAIKVSYTNGVNSAPIHTAYHLD